MSDTFPAVPADMLMRAVDEQIDYTGAYGIPWGHFFAQGRCIGRVGLARIGDADAEAITAGCWARSRGADQAVWLTWAMTEGYPAGDPLAVMFYADELGAVLMRSRRVAIYDPGVVAGLGEWVERDPDESRWSIAVSVPFLMEPGDPDALAALLNVRGHYFAT